MRVISGSARGLKLNTPIDKKIRPTTDRVKESMFNIIAPYVYNSVSLDLFSGSGALGIECLSRGAKLVYFCDNNRDSIKIIKSNIEKSKFYEGSKVIHEDFKNAIERFSKEKIKFDLIFVDPPYYEGLFDKAINTIKSYDILADEGIVIVEHDADITIADFQNLKKYKGKKYGITKLTFYHLEEKYE